MFKIVFLFCFLSTSLIQIALTSGAMPEHPQTAFCKAHFVIRVKILSPRLVDIEEPTTPKEIISDSPPTTEPLIEEFESGLGPTETTVTDASDGDLLASTQFDQTTDSSFTDAPTSPSDIDDEPIDFRKPKDYPPGVPESEDEAEDDEKQPDDGYNPFPGSSRLARFKRSLSFSPRGVAPPPSDLRRRPPHHKRGPIGNKDRDRKMFFYDVLIKKVFKGEDEIRIAKGTFPDASDSRGRRMYARIYFGSHNGLKLEHGGSYLLTGRFMKNRLTVASNRMWMDKWNDLTQDVIQGLKGRYAASCKCEIELCWIPYMCHLNTKKNKCLWGLSNFREPTRDCGALYQCCEEKQGSCEWTTGEGYATCMSPPDLFP